MPSSERSFFFFVSIAQVKKKSNPKKEKTKKLYKPTGLYYNNGRIKRPLLGGSR
jgi:hypothetical protein